MRLTYAADIHGNLSLYKQLLELAIVSDAEAIIVGGDLLPNTTQLSSAIGQQRRFIVEQLGPLLAEFHARHTHRKVFLLAGNDDWAAAIASLDTLAQQNLAFPLHQKVYQLSDQDNSLWLAGYACVPPTPFSIKDYERFDEGSQRSVSFGQAYWSRSGQVAPVSEAEIARLPSIGQDLQELATHSDPKRTIYVCHTPPANTPLDVMRGMRHVGSPGLRHFIEQYQPPLTLHGHIHEAPMLSGSYATQIGTSWAMNPGRDPERLYAVCLDTDDIKGTMRHSVFRRMKEKG